MGQRLLMQGILASVHLGAGSNTRLRRTKSKPLTHWALPMYQMHCGVRFHGITICDGGFDDALATQSGERGEVRSQQGSLMPPRQSFCRLMPPLQGRMCATRAV